MAAGPLKPSFRVETERQERFTMGSSSIDVDPGQDVCLTSAGCELKANGGRRTTSVTPDQLQIKGVSHRSPWPDLRLGRSWSRLAHWLISSR